MTMSLVSGEALKHSRQHALTDLNIEFKRSCSISSEQSYLSGLSKLWLGSMRVVAGQGRVLAIEIISRISTSRDRKIHQQTRIQPLTFAF